MREKTGLPQVAKIVSVLPVIREECWRKVNRRSTKRVNKGSTQHVSGKPVAYI